MSLELVSYQCHVSGVSELSMSCRLCLCLLLCHSGSPEEQDLAPGEGYIRPRIQQGDPNVVVACSVLLLVQMQNNGITQLSVDHSCRPYGKELCSELSNKIRVSSFYKPMLGPIPGSWPMETGVVALQILMDSGNDEFMYNCCVAVFLISERRLRTS